MHHSRALRWVRWAFSYLWLKAETKSDKESWASPYNPYKPSNEFSARPWGCKCINTFNPSSWFVVIVCQSNVPYLLTPSGHVDVQVAPSTTSTASSAWSTARQSCTRSGPSSSISNFGLSTIWIGSIWHTCIFYIASSLFTEKRVRVHVLQ